MNTENHTASQYKLLQSELEAIDKSAPNTTVPGKFLSRLSVLDKLAEIEGKTKLDVIEKERSRIDSIEKENLNSIPELTELRIILRTKEGRLKNRNLSKKDAEIRATSIEATILDDKVGKRYQGEIAEKILFLTRSLRARAASERAQASQPPKL